MKKSLLTFITICFLLVPVLKAQQLPNNGFETWTNANKPASWDASNISVPPFVDYKVVYQETTGSHSGSNCVKMESKEYTAFGITRIVPSFITLGKFWFTTIPQAGGYSEGIVFTTRPDSLKLFYKYSKVANDTGAVVFESWKGVHTTLVAGDTTYITANAPSWTELKIPLGYHSALNPDSLNIVLSASHLYNANVIASLSTLWVDDISLVYGTVSINEIEFNDNFWVSYNVYSSELLVNYKTEKDVNTSIVIYSIDGKLISKTDRLFNNEIQKINISDLKNGNYILTLSTSNGILKSQKFSIFK
ncbi:MAG: PCMD domain-containing protein [Bacteroidetes bacterium]|nr:PCMD domain-containing protein [Bacteroidota bacterium]